MILLAVNSRADGLQITEIDVDVDYDEAYTYRVENRDRIDSASVPAANNSRIDVDVLPGSNITFTVRIENTFQGEKNTLRGVFLTATIEDINDGADLEEESLDAELESGDDYRFEVKFNVPLDSDAMTYNVLLEAEGEDKNDSQHRAELKLKLEVKKQSHDIRITKILLNPSIVSCDRKAKLTAEIKNMGSNPENQVALEFKSSNFGINSYDKDIFLESSEEASDEERIHIKTLNIDVPSFFSAGTYPIYVNLYWKNFVLFDQKIVDLAVKDCGEPQFFNKTEPKKEVDDEERPQIVKDNETKEAVYEKPATVSKEQPFGRSPITIFIFVGLFAVLIISIIVVSRLLKA